MVVGRLDGSSQVWLCQLSASLEGLDSYIFLGFWKGGCVNGGVEDGGEGFADGG